MKKYIFIILAVIVAIIIAITVYLLLFFFRMPDSNLPDHDADKLSFYDIVNRMPVNHDGDNEESKISREKSQWRGVNRNGVYNETSLLQQWPVGGPPLLWKYEEKGVLYLCHGDALMAYKIF